ncbi:MAG: hypothetical protein HN509_02630 [Halobacteriovoraceae bacterium]|nr:hypothetical protein [Halobacteriovoraceae bacterium]MBT5094044.1 hypothetical protein [Halobacteriovoraceae bacterium]
MSVPRGKYHTEAQLVFNSFKELFVSKLERGSGAEKFEKELASYYSLKKCITLSSCRMAFYGLLKELNLPSGSEVLLAPLTVPDMINSIISHDLVPVFLDMDADDHGISKIDLKLKVGSKSKVLLVTHLSGLSVDVESIASFCKQQGLILIEDVSQSHGASYGGRKLGTFGDYSVISFSSGKGICSFVGGAIVSDKESPLCQIATRLQNENSKPSKAMFFFQLLENFKIILLTSRFVFNFLTYPLLRIFLVFFPNKIDQLHKENLLAKFFKRDLHFDDLPVRREQMPKDFNFWFSDWQARVASKTLSSYNRKVEKRKILAKYLISKLEDRAKEKLPKCIERRDQNVFVQLPIFVGEMKFEFQKFLLKRGVDTGSYMLTLCSDTSVFSQYNGPTPEAQKIVNQTVFLPTHESLNLTDMDLIAEAVNEFFRH